MEESLPENHRPTEPPIYRPAEPRVRIVLLTQFGLCVLCVGVYQIISMIVGWSEAPMLTADAPAAERWQTRLQLGLGQFFAFVLAGFLTVWLLYRNITRSGPDWRDYLRVRHWPSASTIGLTVLLMAVSLPLVLFLLNVNQLVPFPEPFKMAEEQTTEMLKGLLNMEHWSEFVANLTLIALLPALGEEIVFRGVVQQQLMRRIANPWVALTVSAAVFSFFHFQFEGFLPRLLLGFLLGWLYWKTQNFWVPALAHFFNNGIQVVGQYLYGKEVSAIDLEQDIQVPWFFAAISAFMVLVTMRVIHQAVDGAQNETAKQQNVEP